MLYASREEDRTARGPINEEVTVLVPTYNEQDTIQMKLQNIFEQTYPRQLIRVVIADSASTDNTRELALDFHKGHPELSVRIVEEGKRRGKPAAIAQATGRCDTDIIVITDADIELRDYSLARITENFADPLIGAVTGRQEIPNPLSSSNTEVESAYRGICDVLRIGESRLDSTPIFAGEFMAFRKTAARNWDPDSVADDTALALQIRKNGYRTIMDPRAVFIEQAALSFRARMRQKGRRGMGIIQALLRSRGMLFRHVYGIFGSLILPAELFLHVVSPLLFVSSLGLLLSGVFVGKAMLLLSPGLQLLSLVVLLGSLLVLLRRKRLRQVLLFVASYVTAQLFLFYAIILLIRYRISPSARSQLLQWERILETRAASAAFAH